MDNPEIETITRTKTVIKKVPFYKSLKKTLGLIGFFLYWLAQVPAILQDPAIVAQLALTNGAMVLGLLGIKTAGVLIANANKKS